jgi:hypothetical protein
VLTVLAILILASVVTLLVVNANSSQSNTASMSGSAPAILAGHDFTPYLETSTRGVTESAGRVTSSGSEIVAVGSETGQPVPRAQFFVSMNDGQSWTMGTLTARGGGAPEPGHAALFVAGGQGAWAAVGSDSVWTSADGRSWTLASDSGLPRLPGDQIMVLKRTAAGFIAAGMNVPDGNSARSTPVIFLSANGSGWQRLGDNQLRLAADGGRALDIRLAASRGNRVLIAGDVATPQLTGTGRRRHTVTVSTGGAWLSDGNSGWTPVTVPTGYGARPQFTDAAVTENGFLLVRPAVVDDAPAADVYQSRNGTTWKYAATLTVPGGFVPSLMNGGSDGAVITGYSGRTLVAFFSRDGVRWQRSQVPGDAAEVVSGVAMTDAGAVISTGTGTTSTGSDHELITMASPAAGARVKILRMNSIAGGAEPQLAVNAVAAAGSEEVVAGGANGFPATWFSANGGVTWRRGTGDALAVFGRPGLEQLTSVTRGAVGWVAVGCVTAGSAEHPVVLSSANGVIWSAADGERAFAGTGLSTAQVAARDGVYVIVGYQQVRAGTIAAAWSSAGLSGWQRADTPADALSTGGNARMLAVTATGTGFVAVGSRDSFPAAWTSSDGRTWVRAEVPLPAGAMSGALQHVAADGLTVIATGVARTLAGAVAFSARSADGGRTWTGSVLPVPADHTRVTALAAADGVFIATGILGTVPGQENVVVWTSRGGMIWRQAEPSGEGLTSPGVQAITGLAAAGQTVTGVGFTASPASEQPILWQFGVR